MDAFYASVEQRDDPQLRGKPVAVGGGHRGVVTAASYEARKFGVRSAMPSVTAKRRCPELIFVKPRFDVYRAVSQQIRAIFADYTDLVEPLSLDEAYLDVTEDRRGLGSARAIAEDIRRRIREECQLTASAGVSLLQVHRQARLRPSQARRPVRDHAGARRGVRRLAAGRALPRRRAGDRAARWSGSASSPAPTCATGACPRSRRSSEARADWYWRICRGIDEREVKPDRPYKSVSAERTFDEDLRDPERLAAELERIAGYAWDADRARRSRRPDGDAQGQVRRFHDHHAVEELRRDRARPGRLSRAAGQALLAALHPLPKGIRLLGLGLHNLTEDDAADTAAAGTRNLRSSSDIKLSHGAAAIQLRP